MTRKKCTFVVTFWIILCLLLSFATFNVNAEICVFYQGDSDWGSHSYGSGPSGPATISSAGCGILSYVNAVYYLNGQFIEPTMLADWSVNNGYRINGVGTDNALYQAFADSEGSSYGIAYGGSSSSYDVLRQHLQSGEVAIGSAPGHLMAVVDYDSSNGKFLILDSSPNTGRYTYNTGYTWQTASSCQNTYKLNFSAFYFIKNTGVIPPPHPFEEDTRYPKTITAFPLATSGKITVYNSSLIAYDIDERNISWDDKCTINTVYTNGYSDVTYPTPSGERSAYVRTDSFFNTSTTTMWSPSDYISSYTRSDLKTEFGTVYPTDSCIVVEQKGNLKQLIYPVPGGYKLGWVNNEVIPPSELPSPMKGYNASPSNRTTVYQTLGSLGGEKYGEIFIDDQCTFDSISVSGGWGHASYPLVTGGSKAGYVYLSEFIPNDSKLTHHYKTTVTSQVTTYRKSDMAVSYGHVSPGDEMTIVGRSGNKLQVYYPIDEQYGGGWKLAWIYDSSAVKKNLVEIAVTSKPSKQTYKEGETFDKSGLVITAKNDDGSTANVTNSCTFTGFDTTPGVKTITATYSGKTASFTVTVNEKKVNAITINSLPSKQNYKVGEELDLSGLSVSVDYDNNTTADVTSNMLFFEDESDDLSTPGEKNIVLLYNYGNTANTVSFKVNVSEPTPTYVLGDVNDDDEIDFADAILILQADVRKITLSEEQITAADVNKDGNVDFADAMLVLQYDSKKISSF